MKLQELFENNPIHFVDDDLSTLFEDNQFIGSQSFNNQYISFDVAYSRPIGTYNGLEIWGSRYLGKDTDLYGILDDKRNILAWAIFNNKMHFGYSTFIRAWVNPKERGKDHTLTIINFLTAKAKEKIFIDKDEQTSSDSRKFMKKWINYPSQKRHFNIAFYDTNGKIQNPDIDNILKSGSKNDVYMIFESIFDKTFPRYGAGKRVFHDIVWY